MVVGRPASLVGAAGRDQIAADDGMQVHSELLVAWLSGLTWYDAGGPDREGAPEARAAGGRGLGGASGGRARRSGDVRRRDLQRRASRPGRSEAPRRA